MEVNARIALGLRDQFYFEFEIPEVCSVYRACVKQVRARPVGG
jgi:hypothetical protein